MRVSLCVIDDRLGIKTVSVCEFTSKSPTDPASQKRAGEENNNISWTLACDIPSMVVELVLDWMNY